MSQFVVNLSEPEKEETPVNQKETAVNQDSAETIFSKAGDIQTPKKGRGCRRLLIISGIVLSAFLLICVVIGYFYWQGVKHTPPYSLALLVDAGRSGDQKMIDELVDTDAVVESFLPQITAKAIELYGKNLPPEKITKVKEAANPLMPAIKQRAREEVPRVIQEKTDKFTSIPYWAIALFAGWYLDSKPDGQTAVITSKIPDRPFELTMKQNGDKWRVIAIKDDLLAEKIAKQIGQEMIAISTKDGLKKTKEKIGGATDLDGIKKKIEDIFK